jgi:outer membrane protein assembly factor BamE (lipoprotein component of BamABCDE complex)
MKKTVLALIIAVAVAGCSSPKEIRKPITRVVAGKTVPTREVPSIRGYEIVKEYGLGRRIDPNNPNIMYGPCKMYVIRRTPTWNLTPHGPVTNKPFKEQIHPLKVKFENMKRQQDLIDERNKTTGKIGLELLKIRDELQKTSSKKVKEDLAAELKKLNADQGKVKRKMAELEK